MAVAKKFANGAVYMLHPMKNRGILDSTWGGCLGDMVRFVQEIAIVRRERLIEQVPQKTALLVAGLNDLAERYKDIMFNIRGMGLYQGFSLRREDDLSRLRQMALNQENMLLLGAGQQTVRFRPMLDVSVEEIRLMLEKLQRCLAGL